MAEQIPFSIVENVLSSLGSSVVQKLGSVYGVRKELEKLEETLGTLNAVLLDAEEQLEKSHAVKDWVKRLKRVVYAVDDLVDDFATYQLRRGVGGGPARQVSRFFSCSSSSNQVAFRFHMSGRVADIKEALDDIKRDIFLLSAIPQNTTHPRPYNTRREAHSSPSSTSINLDLRNAEIEKIVNLLVSPGNDQDVFIVVICGIGGLGKTTLAQLVFNDERVTKHFEPKIWVCVSDNDSGHEGFSEKELLKKITKSENDKPVEDLKKTLNESLSQKKYLLVLDDVWNNRREDWEKVRPLLEVGSKGSKILVTTRNTEVSFMGKNNRPFELEGLGKGESWNLFSNITFGEQENSVSEEIKKVGRQIVDMCNGVPLIINTLGGILTQFKSDLSKWESIRDNENLLSLPRGNDNVLRLLKLCYDNLPTHLKQCFIYCALFPQDYVIEKKLLVQLWMAQGYIQSPNKDEQLEDIGKRYFEELVSRSLLKKVEEDYLEDDELIYNMHDLIHDLAQSIVGSEVLILRNDVSNISREARHISLLFEMEAIIEKKAIVGKPIRTFLNLYPDVLKDAAILNSFLSSVMGLRALSLDDLDIEKVPKSIGKLIHLRYLDLSNNKFEMLPNSITGLKNLQTLKLEFCNKLKTFPKNMRELINLRHLENDECDGLTHMPHGIGKLTSLQSLPVFVVGNGIDKGRLRNNQRVGRLSELESLNQLRGQLSITNLENVRDVELVSMRSILEKKRYLEALRLEWKVGRENEEGDKRVMECLRPNPQVKKLFIKGYGDEEFPVSWMMNDIHDQDQLKEGEGEGSSTTPELLPFSSLESLIIRDLPMLKKLRRMESSNSFSQLSKLVIDNCPNLQSLELLSSHCLSKLKIMDCPNLESFNVASLTSLEELRLGGVRAEVMRQLISVSASSSLEFLAIRGMIIADPAEEPEKPLQYVSTLETLFIRKCSGSDLTTLLHSMGNLSSSLRELVIYDCPELTSLPQLVIFSLQKLQRLYLCRCPLLEQRYNKETGEDRAKIAHIPLVSFYLPISVYRKVRDMLYAA